MGQYLPPMTASRVGVPQGLRRRFGQASWSRSRASERIPDRWAVVSASLCQARARGSPARRASGTVSVNAQTCDHRCPPRYGRLRVMAHASPGKQRGHPGDAPFPHRGEVRVGDGPAVLDGIDSRSDCGVDGFRAGAVDRHPTAPRVRSFGRAREHVRGPVCNEPPAWAEVVTNDLRPAAGPQRLLLGRRWQLGGGHFARQTWEVTAWWCQEPAGRDDLWLPVLACQPHAAHDDQIPLVVVFDHAYANEQALHGPVSTPVACDQACDGDGAAGILGHRRIS
jgi:hypothetical protein